MTDPIIKKLIYKVEDNVFNSDLKSPSKSEYLCVCSGGTTSNCARNGFITLDLRKKYNQIHFEKEDNLIKIGGGVIMKDLMNFLESHNKTFLILLYYLLEWRDEIDLTYMFTPMTIISESVLL